MITCGYTGLASSLAGTLHYEADKADYSKSMKELKTGAAKEGFLWDVLMRMGPVCESASENKMPYKVRIK